MGDLWGDASLRVWVFHGNRTSGADCCIHVPGAGNNRRMTRLDAHHQRRFDALASPYLRDERVRDMRRFIQHGNTTTYAHCVRVARESYALATRLNLQLDYDNLVAGALLHDFYRYDWHDRSTSKPYHATRHPLYAAENAVELLEVNPEVRAIIETHMWPLPPNRIPRSREAWLVCAVDKAVSLQETLTLSRGRRAMHETHA